ncbi:MAG: HPF/RaiA family ribosome-associated protein [Gammaproteobacteria bacterium]|nr:HPF/RaiA family ribosome-associated protein [Gammaproteobacteria bacterium]
MQVPLEITFRNVSPSESVAAKVRERAGKLERFVDKIIGCKVTIEAPHKHHYKGSTYQVKIDVTVPGSEIVVSRHPGQNKAHEDVYVAVRDAFDATRRQLEDYIAQRKGKVKHHESFALSS